MLRRPIFVVVLVFAALPAVCLQADDRQAIERQLNDTFRDKILTLRKFTCGDKLSFDAQGEPLRSKPGAWTSCGQIRVKQIRVGSKTLEIDGERTVTFCSEDKLLSLSAAELPVEINLGISDRGASLEDIKHQMLKVFLAAEENLNDFVPDYWKPYLTNAPELQKKPHPPEGPSDAAKSITTNPVPIRKPDPPYTPEARRLKLHGTLHLWVDIDDRGNVGRALVVKPLGIGLDDETVNTVRTWKFKPATRDGVPVKTQVFIEVTFRLF